MDFLRVKAAIETHPSFAATSSADLREWLKEEVDQAKRAEIDELYRLALQYGVDVELEELLDHPDATDDEKRAAKRILRILGQTVLHDVDLGHTETQDDFALMTNSARVLSFDATFTAEAAKLGTQKVKRHQSLGIGLPLVRQIEKARSL